MNHPDFLQRIFEQYPLVVVQHTHLRTSENRVVQLCGEDGASYALRIRRLVGAYREQLASELIFLRDLRVGTGADIPVPVATRSGELLCLQQDGADVYMCILFSWVAGTHVGGSELTVEHVGQMARAVARLHGFSLTYVPPPGFIRPTYDAAWFLGATSWRARADFIKLIEPAAAACLHRVSDALGVFLQSYPRTAATFGLIHYDLHAGNFLFHEGVANMIDFDECGWGYYLFDLAHILFEFMERPDYEELKRMAVSTYRAESGPVPVLDHDLNLFLGLQGVAYANWMYRLYWRDGRTDALDYWMPRIMRRVQHLGL